MSDNPVFAQIEQDLRENDVVLYMKGSAVFPQCGFSAAVVQVLGKLGVPFKGINILEDADLRQGVKDYANWPTIPQLYIKGEFVGGCDIVREMAESGELQEMLKQNGITVQDAA